MDTTVVFYAHAGFMMAGFLLMISGVTVAVLLRRRRWWLQIHKTVGTLAPVFLLCGFIAAIAMVYLSAGEHFGVTHAYLGIGTVAFAVLTPVLGHLQFLLKGASGKIRVLHRWSGRVTVVIACAAVVSGLKIAGIF